jgi:hypothetical protein
MSYQSKLATVRAVLALSDNEDGWEALSADEELLIWDEHGEQVETWNTMFGEEAGLDELLDEWRDTESGQEQSLRYRGRKRIVPCKFSREDDAILIHTIDQLVGEDTPLRFCTDTSGSSTVAFLALRAEDWAALENEFGKERVAYRFLPLANDVDQFIEEVLCTDYPRGKRAQVDKVDPPADPFAHLRHSEPATALQLIDAFCYAVRAMARQFDPLAEATRTVLMDRVVSLMVILNTPKKREIVLFSPVFKEKLTALRVALDTESKGQVVVPCVWINSDQEIMAGGDTLSLAEWMNEMMSDRITWHDGAPVSQRRTNR